MIAPPPGVRVLVWSEPVDFRAGMDRLAALVQITLRQDPFLCVGRRNVAAPSRREQFRGVDEFCRHIIFHGTPRGQGVPGPLAKGEFHVGAVLQVSTGAPATSEWSTGW